jgi:gamma-glutamylcyclotransferase (GGCT)/AIG2-like uncharacterized protein YtfP
MMETDVRYLFVYGTLMRGAVGALGAAQRDRLVRESRSLGAATMAGAELYDLGRYPGLVESADTSLVVHGEVVELLSAPRTLAWLDAYEGIAAGDQSEYSRQARPVHLPSGQTVEAWVYLLRREARGHVRIRGGRWKRSR